MIKDYIQLVKFRYHLTFISVIVGAIFFAKEINFQLFIDLILVYVSFNILMYTGLYTMNDIFDRKDDANHPKKKNRVIACGKICVLNASIFAVIIIFLGLIMSFLLWKNIFYFYLVFIAFNLIYSYLLKKIPYIELLGNSITHPLRFMLGVSLVGANIPISLVVAYFFVAIGILTERRIIEMDYKGHESRKVLLHYTKLKLSLIKVLSLVIIIILFLIDYPKNILLYSLLILFYFIFVFIIGHSKKFRPLLQKIWLN